MKISPLQFLRTDERLVSFEGHHMTMVEDVCAYRGAKIIIGRGADFAEFEDLSIEVELGAGGSDGFDTVREAMAWVDRQIAEPVEDVSGDWLAYVEEHSLRSWQLR